jgi:outer membrane protein OmpA-like peptidoglycan-associated protein
MLPPPKEKMTIEVQRSDGPKYGGQRYATQDNPKSARITLFFNLDSDVLLPEARNQIEAIAKQAVNATVYLYGACCPLGTDAYNLALGMARAESVRRYLMEISNPANVIMESWGETHLVSEVPDNYFLNRRVEVQIGE